MIQPQRQKIRTNKFQCNDHNVFWWVDIHQRLKNKQKKTIVCVHCLIGYGLIHWSNLISRKIVNNIRNDGLGCSGWRSYSGSGQSRVVYWSFTGRPRFTALISNKQFVLLLQDEGSGEVNQEQSVEWGRYHLWVLASNFCHTLFASEANDEGM